MEENEEGEVDKVQKLLGSLVRGENNPVHFSLIKRHTPEFMGLIEDSKVDEIKFIHRGKIYKIAPFEGGDSGSLIGITPGTMKDLELSSENFK